MLIDIEAPRPCALLLALLLTACAAKDKDGTDGATDTGSQSTGSPSTDTTDASATDSATDSATASGPTTSTTATSSDTDGVPAGCACAVPAPCSVPLCSTVAFDQDNLDSGGIDTDGDVELEAALTCALAALRDGKPGRIDWTYKVGQGQVEQYGSFELFGDGTARRSFGGIEDLCTYLSDDVSVGPLRDAKVYDDCLTEPETLTRFACVRNAVVTVLDVCQVGELDCSGI